MYAHEKMDLQRIAQQAANIVAATEVDWTKLYMADDKELLKLAGMLGYVKGAADIINATVKILLMTEEEMRAALAKIAEGRNAPKDDVSVGSKS